MSEVRAISIWGQPKNECVAAAVAAAAVTAATEVAAADVRFVNN